MSASSERLVESDVIVPELSTRRVCRVPGDKGATGRVLSVLSVLSVLKANRAIKATRVTRVTPVTPASRVIQGEGRPR